MSGTFEQAVRRALRTFRAHPEVRNVVLAELDQDGAKALLRINVEMPLAWCSAGVSPNGVRREEVVTVVFRTDYPWSSPRFYLRSDFDRALPHIQPGRLDQPPEPCLVDGPLEEYFVEAGLLALVEQLCLWLNRAAKGALINSVQGWEPIRRDNVSNELIAHPEYLRGLVDRRGGSRALPISFLRMGPSNAPLGEDAHVFGRIFSEPTPLNTNVNPELLSVRTLDRTTTAGSSVALAIWPGRNPDGSEIVADRYFPETICALDDLVARAEQLGCKQSLIESLERLERLYKGKACELPIPIAVVFCVRRPYSLIGSNSRIELLPYTFDWRLEPDRRKLTDSKHLPVAPALQLDSVSPELLARVSGAAPAGAICILGCGSLGSKLAIQMARSGTKILTVSDAASLKPHNLARHGLLEMSCKTKARALAEAMAGLGQETAAYDADLVSWLGNDSRARTLIPKNAALALDTTAALRIRSRLSNLGKRVIRTRLACAALFGDGYGGYVMLEGPDRAPTLDDITVEYYQRLAMDPDLRALAADEDGELRRIETGQGCGTLTMPMADARVSVMAGIIGEEIDRLNRDPPASGQLVLAICDRASGAMNRLTRKVESPTEVKSGGRGAWRFRIHERALERIKADIALHPTVETGGVLLGRANHQLRTINVVDVLDAPSDSQRSPAHFRLGTMDLRHAIERYHQASGKTLYDVGTWHSHLSDQPPSPRDTETARELSRERPPPYGLLIVAPNRMFGVLYSDSESST